jgi:integrase
VALLPSADQHPVEDALATALAAVAAAAAKGPEALAVVNKALASATQAGDAHGATSLCDSFIVDNVPGGVSTTERDKDMPKIDGPYAHGKRFRIRVRERGKPAKVISFATEIDAKAEARRLRREIARQHGITVQQAINTYTEHMRKDRGLKERSIETTVYRLTRLFGRAIDQPIATITPAKAKELYLGLTGAVDSRMNTLAEAKTFFQFAKARGMTPVHPLEGVKGEGRRHYGKAKLSRDEARKFLAKCLELAGSGREKQRVAAVAAAMPLVFGLRASEVTERQVRDLDDQGAILRVTRAKSRAGIRSLQVPDWFKPHLQALAANKQPNDLLVGHDRTWLHRHVGQICAAAGVPKVPTHGLRGTHSDLALVAASTPLAVSQALGHESVSTTFKHYADENLAEQNDHQRATAALVPN